ncbi:MAG: transposase [Conexivisphaerales archaeon]
MLNSIIADIWGSIVWKKKMQEGKKKQQQYRLIPNYRKDKQFRAELRNKYLVGWDYAAHWVDSALKTAFSIMKSWRKNYVKGRRKALCPKAKRLFVRAKQTLCKLEGEGLRVTIAPHRFVYFDLSKRYFKLPDNVSSNGIGEPIITPEQIHLPINVQDERIEPIAEKIAWDSNMMSMDAYSPETGWVKIDTRALAAVHISSFEKRRSVQRKASKSKKVKRILAKYSRRERNRARKHQIEVARVIRSLARVNGFEELRKEGMYTRSKMWNRGIARTDWRGIMKKVKEWNGNDGDKAIVELQPKNTSKECSRCGLISRDLNGSILECKSCGLKIDRQLNAAINLYLKMEGVPHRREWWDDNILPSLMGGYLLTGAERKAPDELVRELHDAVKPKLYYAYDRYADAYLPMPT